ncbi:MAG: NAD(P)-dependent oxidoreductase [Anaerolineae bacterium]|nr:NAD(P)-dependent oxidoreductase [Anaerolineae bacterium]
MKIVVTGSKGLIGRHTVEYAKTQDGFEVFGVDHIGVGSWPNHYRLADLTDLGQTYSALAGADAVVHLAAIPDHGLVEEPKLFMSNIASTYNVFEAARNLGIKRVVWASTIQVNRTVLMQHDTRYQYLPIDEAHPVDPQNDYALSKYVGEVMAETYAKTYGLSIVSLRFTAITHPDNMKGWPVPQAEAPHWALYAYADVRDAARACFLAATADLPAASHQVAFVVAKDTMVATPSSEIASRFFPDAEVRGDLSGNASLVSNATAKRLFGFEAQYSCRK